jgi:beta-RFAP synthase
MIRVHTPARLHFGLLALPGSKSRLLSEKDSPTAGRRFGGVGLMVQGPGITLTAVPAPRWSASGPLADRVLEFARRFERAMAPREVAPHRFVVENASPEHFGLGTGTQLGLAVAATLAGTCSDLPLDWRSLARALGRGERSAIGVHGFQHGGFLVEGGKGTASEIAPLLVRRPFPEHWRIVLAVPATAIGIHGERECRAFAELLELPAAQHATDTLCRLVLLGMLPALAEADYRAFGEAVFEFNARAGELFAPVQNGTYSSAAIAEVVSSVRSWGVPGVGQSSWGPTVFAITEDSEQSASLARQLAKRFQLTHEEIFVTRCSNRGAHVERNVTFVPCTPAEKAGES